MVGGKLFMCLVKHFMKLVYMSSVIFDVQERQSPINVDTSTLQTALVPPLEWKFFGYHPRSVSLMSNGETIRVNFDQMPVPKLRGGPLEGTYQLNHVHFHWSEEDDTGSEHLLNGEGFPMEMHAVFTKGKLTLEEALNVSDGLAVVGYFVEIDDNSYDPRHPSAMDIITSSFADLPAENVPIRIPPFPSKRLLHKFTKGYVIYHGSLTTPNFSEVVVWILAPYTVKITEDELQSFRNLYPRRLMEHSENVRPVQPINNRPVYLARVWRHKDVPHLSHSTHNIYQKSMFGDDYFEYMYSCRTVGTKARVRVGTCNNYTNYYFNDDVQRLSEPARNRICALHNRDETPLVFGDRSLLYGKDLKGFFGPLTLPLDTIDRC